MRNVKNISMYALGAVIVLSTFVLIGMLVVVILRNPETPLKDTLTLAIGSLLAAFGLVVGYFYGSSRVS